VSEAPSSFAHGGTEGSCDRCVVGQLKKNDLGKRA